MHLFGGSKLKIFWCFFAVILVFSFLMVGSVEAAPKNAIKHRPMAGDRPTIDGSGNLQLTFSAFVDDTVVGSQVKAVFEIREGDIDGPLVPAPDGGWVSAVSSSDSSTWGESSALVTSLSDNTTYYYKVKAVNDDGEESIYSAWWSITFESGATTLPPMPIISDLDGFYQNGETANLSWTFNCADVCYGDLAGWDDFYGFRLEHNLDPNNPDDWVTIQEGNYFSFNYTDTGEVFSYISDLSVNGNVSEHHFRIKVGASTATGAVQYGDPSDHVSLEKILYPPVINSIEAVGANVVKLNFNYSDTSIANLNYEVQFSLNPSGPSWTTIKTGEFTAGSNTIIDIDGLSPNTIYYMRIRAVDVYSTPNTNGPWSNVISTQTWPASTIDNLSVTALLPTEARLNWSYNNVLSGVSQFNIEFNMVSGNPGDANWSADLPQWGDEVFTCDSGNCSLNIRTLVPSETYYFRIQYYPDGAWYYWPAVTMADMPIVDNYFTAEVINNASGNQGRIKPSWGFECAPVVAWGGLIYNNCLSPYLNWDSDFDGFWLEHSTDQVSWTTLENSNDSNFFDCEDVNDADNDCYFIHYESSYDTHYYRLRVRANTHLGIVYGEPVITSVQKVLYAPELAVTALGANSANIVYTYPYFEVPKLRFQVVYSRDPNIDINDWPTIYNSDDWPTIHNSTEVISESSHSWDFDYWRFFPDRLYYLAVRVIDDSASENNIGPWSDLVSFNTWPASNPFDIVLGNAVANDLYINWQYDYEVSGWSRFVIQFNKTSNDPDSNDWHGINGWWWVTCDANDSNPVCSQWARFSPEQDYYIRARMYSDSNNPEPWQYSALPLTTEAIPAVDDFSGAFVDDSIIRLNWSFPCGWNNYNYSCSSLSELTGWKSFRYFKLDYSSDGLNWENLVDGQQPSWMSPTGLSFVSRDDFATNYTYAHNQTSIGPHYYRLSTRAWSDAGAIYSDPTEIIVQKPDLAVPSITNAVKLGAHFGWMEWEYEANCDSCGLTFEVQTNVVSGDQVDTNWTDFDQFNRSPSLTNFYDKTLTPLDDDTTYYIRIRAVDTLTDPVTLGDWSEVASFTTDPASDPYNFTSTVKDLTTVILDWQYDHNLSNWSLFEIEYSHQPSVEADWTDVPYLNNPYACWATDADSICSEEVGGLIPGETYYFRIRSYPDGAWTYLGDGLVELGPSCTEIRFVTGPFVYPIRVDQVEELRYIINECLIGSLALSPINFIDADLSSTTDIRAVHLSEPGQKVGLRDAVEIIYARLAEAYSEDGRWISFLPWVGVDEDDDSGHWIDYDIIARETIIRTTHFQQIRDALCYLTEDQEGCASGDASDPTDTGYKYAGRVVNDPSVGDTPWSNPENGEGAEDNIVASVNTNTFSNYIKATDFGFNIPDGATINGIKVEAFWGQTGICSQVNLSDWQVRMVKNNAVTGSNRALDQNICGLQMITYGGEDDLWGVDWTAGDINSDNFGVALAIYKVFGDFTVGFDFDAVSITVYYTP